MKGKRTLCFLLSLVLVLGLFSGPACQVHALETQASDAAAAQPEQMRYANSDQEASSADWCYILDGGTLVRHRFDFSDWETIRPEQTSQVTYLDGFVYILYPHQGGSRIDRMAEDTLLAETLLTSPAPIDRFAVTSDTLYYLTEGTIYVRDMESSPARVLLSTREVHRFWLRSEEVLEYMLEDEALIYQYDLSTGNVRIYENIVSDASLMPLDAEPQGLTIGELRTKFPHGKYWNHAGNPGAENSKNNQNSYTSTPCPVHNVIGTSKQTCNGFAPSGTQLSWQCMGYAEKLGYDATGYNPRTNANGWYTYSDASALDNLKAGDIVRHRNGTHSIYITAVNGDTITYTDCNWGGKCNIRWDATITRSTLLSTFSYVRSAPTGQTPEPTACRCTATYEGSYTCTTTSTGLNMRSGHGTSYSIVTKIPNGATVHVTKASGSSNSDWAHVEYDGYSGYASMQYLERQPDVPARNTTVHTWMSGSAAGSTIASVRAGDPFYFCYKIYDKDSGEMLDSYNTAAYTVTLKLYDPSDKVVHTSTLSKDAASVSVKGTTPGTYRGQVVFAFESGESLTVETTIKVVYQPQVTVSASAVSLDVKGTNARTVTVSHSGATTSDSVLLEAQSDSKAFTCTWGSWSNDTRPLTITGVRAGQGTITVNLLDGDSRALLASTQISVTVTAPSYTVRYNANGGSGAPASQTKAYGVSLTLSKTVPVWAGHTFLGWAASAGAASPAYQPGSTYTANADLTLYALWEENCDIGHSYADGVCTRCGAADPDFGVIASGWSGSLTWKLRDDGTLTFYGSGKMKNYASKTDMPWYPYRDQFTHVVLEEGVTSIGDCAFYGMDIRSIRIPDTVTSIGDFAFKNATRLENVVLPKGLTQLGNSAFYGCTGLEHIEIPASLWTVQPYAFKYCANLTSVTFHEGNLMKISDGAFYGTGLTALDLPDCLDIVDVYAFKNCEDLSSIRLGASLTEVRDAVFYGSAISSVTIPEGVTRIGSYAFKNCVNLRSIDLPGTLTEVDDSSFYGCTALEALDLPDSVTRIGHYAFRRCTGLTELHLGASLKQIGDSSFYGCTGLTGLEIPGKVTTIGSYAFKGCTGLKSVTLPGSLTTLEDSAFHTCTGLTQVTIPGSVKQIGPYCFSGSTGIRSVTFQGNAPAIGAVAFGRVTANAYYPGSNLTWTSEVRQNYGGSLTWIAR